MYWVNEWVDLWTTEPRNEWLQHRLGNFTLGCDETTMHVSTTPIWSIPCMGPSCHNLIAISDQFHITVISTVLMLCTVGTIDLQNCYYIGARITKNLLFYLFTKLINCVLCIMYYYLIIYPRMRWIDNVALMGGEVDFCILIIVWWVACAKVQNFYTFYFE